MTIEQSKQLISDWNGEDTYFLSNGDVYSEYDVQEAIEIIENHEKTN